MTIHSMTSSAEIDECHEAYLELRPHLMDADEFVTQVLLQMVEGFQIHAIREESGVVACIGYRVMTTLAWGKILYIDDLIVRESTRGKGYGSQLLKHAIAHAKEIGCNQVHLDTGYTRHAAHKAYLKHGFEINCHHMALQLS